MKSWIIPACAGNTTNIYEDVTGWRDHPRMRGEHLSGASEPILAAGSSPHARGTPPDRPCE